MFETLGEVMWSGLVKPYDLITDPSQRAYAPFLLTSLAIAFAVLLVRARSARAVVRAMFSRRLWLHRSSLMDVRLIVAKAIIALVVLAPIAVSAFAVAVWTFEGMVTHIGAPEATAAWSRWQVIAVYTVVLFVAWDASRYLVHRLMHRVPLLWEFHKVHHSAEVLTPFTVYRVHPVESFLMGLRGALVTGVVTGAFFYWFGDMAIQYELLGVNAIGLGLNALGANLRHSHVWLSYGRRVERVLISPAQHQIHHSADPADFDSNYGSFLSVWDLLGGTLRLAGRRRAMTYGLDAAELNHDPARVTSAIVGPFATIARSAADRVSASPPPAGESANETTTA
jgi:sterol desaturase/sphingolipid hydroxylase (fatty acid hydroxylase superfamily)